MKRRYIIYWLNCIILGLIIGIALADATIFKESYLIVILATIAFGLHVYSYYKDTKEREQNK